MQQLTGLLRVRPWRRKMYDCVVAEGPLLPNGVSLPEVLEGAAESEVAGVLASIPAQGRQISAAALVAAGLLAGPGSLPACMLACCHVLLSRQVCCAVGERVPPCCLTIGTLSCEAPCCCGAGDLITNPHISPYHESQRLSSGFHCPCAPVLRPR